MTLRGYQRDDARRLQRCFYEGAELAAARVALRGVTALSWLQRHGTLRWGPDVVYRELAFALGREEQVKRWKSDAAGAARGAVVWGAARVDEAVTTWEAMESEGVTA